jgi:hypothetical protein
MDSLVNLLAIVSLTGVTGVALGQALIGVGMPLLLVIGMLDGQKGGNLDKK